MVRKNCSECGKAAIISEGCGCSAAHGNLFLPELSDCGSSEQNRSGLLKTAACGLTSTIFRIVNGADRLLSCGCRR